MSTEFKIYQVVYCDSKFWDERKPLTEQVESTFRWYLIECPLIGIKDIATARHLAKEKLKTEFRARSAVIYFLMNLGVIKLMKERD